MKGIDRSNRLFMAFIIAASACDKGVTPNAAPRSAVTGSITGSVHTAAKARSSIALPEGVRKVCGDSIGDQSLLIGPNGELANAVVWVDDAAPTPAEGRPSPLLDQRQCAYQPPVLVAHTGAKLKVKNSDPLMHNVRASELFNVGMPIENQTIERPLPAEPGPVKVVCDVHPWMRADVMVLPHDQWAITNAEGRFTLRDVKGGARPLKVWHPLLGEKSVSVDVPAGGEGKLVTSL